MPILRKDLKIGFLAGAVLLVLAVGYGLFLTFSGDDLPAPPPAALLEGGLQEPDGASPAAGQNGDSTALGELEGSMKMLARTRTTPADDWSSAFDSSQALVTRIPGPDEAALQGEEFVPASPDLNQRVPADADPAMAGEGGDVVAPPIADVAGIKTHVIAAGDSFSSIAQKYYGDANLFMLIQKANPNVDPRRMRPGQKLIIPERELASPSPAAGAGAVHTAGSSANDPSGYTVQAGDTLARIALRELGQETRWEEIYKLNREQIGDNPARLKVGMKLKMPG